MLINMLIQQLWLQECTCSECAHS